MPALPLYVFDAYGTLFDVHSAVARHRALVGEPADRLSQMWRTKQLEYTWVRSLMGRYRDFAALTEESLDFAAAACGGISAQAREKLLEAYQTLDAYPEVKPVLTRLKADGAKVAILSNSTPAMLKSAIGSSGLDALIDAALSIDPLRRYKTLPQAYELVGAHFGVGPEKVSFQSSNRWDAAAATSFGFHAVWINRSGAPDEYFDLPAARVLSSLEALA